MRRKIFSASISIVAGLGVLAALLYIPWDTGIPSAGARAVFLDGAVFVPAAAPPGSHAPATVPNLINFQGRLTSPATGNAVGDGDYTVAFRVFDAASGGTHVWTETQTVPVDAGLFSVQLGSVTPFPANAFNGTTRHLELQVGADPPMTPRLPFTSVAYAFHSLTADSANSADNAGMLDGLDSTQFVRLNMPNVGNISMTGSIGLAGNATLSGALFADSLSATGNAVLVNQNGPDGDSSICFYEAGAPCTETLQWDDANHRFNITDDVQGQSLSSQGGAFINVDGPDGNSAICFWEAGLACNEALTWEDANNRFAFSDELTALGDLSTFGNVFVNQDGPEGNSALCFFNTATPCGASLTWNDSLEGGSFVLNSGLTVQGNFHGGNITAAANAFINQDGPDGDSLICFWEGVACGRSLAWDDSANQFLFNDDLSITGNLSTTGIVSLGLAAAGTTQLCRNVGNFIGTCSSSLRYKEDVEDLRFDVDKLLTLRPVAFKWKDSEERGVGLIAEEVETLLPELVTYANGEVEGVNYDQLTVYLLELLKQHERELEELRSGSADSVGVTPERAGSSDTDIGLLAGVAIGSGFAGALLGAILAALALVPRLVPGKSSRSES
jgi:hypothetical protein